VQLIAGHACKVVEYNGNLVCDICEPNDIAFGIIGRSKLVRGTELNFDPKLMTIVWTQRMIFHSDKFENNIYEPGDKIYVGNGGILTNEPVCDDNNFVARLILAPNDKRNYYEALWL